ncbi:unnamed protein product [Clonostachys rosea]|uniref:non-specific serine/threonine protein kinase n=1 Tax=Bionectria ochroleuca TaxID=29856 RepID=A0ABY6UGG7_BIOOC|nr:unnamed protein product [Clonostachys rosea]
MGLFIGTIFPTRWRLWLGRQLFAHIDEKVTRISWHRIVKGHCDPPEVEAMQYIASNINIPIPKLYGTHIHDGKLYIEMEYIPGETLENAWKSLSSGQHIAIAADIRHYISVLRALQPPTDLVSSAFQNPASDFRIGYRFLGPVPVSEFHSIIRGHLHRDDWHLIGKEMEVVHTSNYKICFTHADLAPRNIMVRNGRVVSIIDWACSGWFPEYWEFTRAHYFFLNKDWRDTIRLALPCYETELKSEQSLWRMIPEPGNKTFTSVPRFDKPGSNPSDAWLDSREGRHLDDLWSLRSVQGRIT